MLSSKAQCPCAWRSIPAPIHTYTWFSRVLASKGPRESAGAQRAYSRRPTPAELDLGLTAIAEFRKQWPARLDSDNSDAPRAANAEWLGLANYCHAILNSAEFSFID
jgi:hypothetical protein